jgi:hypothetical protein
MKQFILRLIFIILAISGIAIAFNLIVGRSNKSNIKEINTLQKKYDSVQFVISKLNDSIASEKATILSLNSLDKSLIEQYKNKKEELKSIQNEFEKQNVIIDNLNCIELQRSLTERYNTTER